MSAMKIRDDFGNSWQYHSRSDRHSKIVCWAIMFDLLLHSSLLRAHAKDGKVGFGINHELTDFQTNRKKNLDLVVCTPNLSNPPKIKKGKITREPVADFVALAAETQVVLQSDERDALAKLPVLPIVGVGGVNIALEAKATMTAHIAALPRLHDELDSSHSTVHGHADHALAAGLVMVNISTTFVSPDMNKFPRGILPERINEHKQPKAAEQTISKILEIRRRSAPAQAGFDALGIVVVNFKNDGTPMNIVSSKPAPQVSEPYHYDQMINRLVSLYATKFSSL